MPIQATSRDTAMRNRLRLAVEQDSECYDRLIGASDCDLHVIVLSVLGPCRVLSVRRRAKGRPFRRGFSLCGSRGIDAERSTGSGFWT